MNRENVCIIILAAIIFVIAAIALFLKPAEVKTQIEIRNFNECVAAGFPVMESYPRQCSANGNNFVEEIDDKKYISNSPEQCQTIRFVCESDREPFFDETGCGCERILQEPEKTYCPSESREAEACTMDYNPVCGWFNSEKIQCITYPCAQTYSNSCGACINPNVEYWTRGECPTPS
jgi:hypothetical protein